MNEEQQAAARQLAERLINKLMHPCATALREHGLAPSSATLAQALHAVTLKHRPSRRA
jgi:hypothetical protein